MSGRAKQPIAGLYAITPNGRPMDRLLAETEAALKGGANLVQFRDKSSNQKQRLQTAQALVALCAKFGKPLIVNDDIELALETGATGVHLGQQDGSVAKARTLLGDDAIIGATCHDSIELASRAKQQGASYLAFGRFFKSSTKPDAPPASFAVLTEAKKLGLPIVAIGGITHLNAGQLLHHGINSIAVIEALFGTEVIEVTDEINTEAITASATEFRKLFDQSL